MPRSSIASVRGSSRAFGHRYYGSDGVQQRLNRNTRCARRRRFGKVEAQFAGLPGRYGHLYFEDRVTAFRAGEDRHPLAIGKRAHQFRIFRREKTNRGQHGAAWHLDRNLRKKARRTGYVVRQWLIGAVFVNRTVTVDFLVSPSQPSAAYSICLFR